MELDQVGEIELEKEVFQEVKVQTILIENGLVVTFKKNVEKR